MDEIRRDRVLTDEELSLIWRQAGEGDYGAIVRLLILTGQRREEVAAMTWEEAGLDGATWRIGAERTKNGLAHEVALTQPALEILGARRRSDGRALVFGSHGPFSGWSKAKAALDARMSAAYGGLRCRRGGCTTFEERSQLGCGLGALPHVMEAVLNHISGS